MSSTITLTANRSAKLSQKYPYVNYPNPSYVDLRPSDELTYDYLLLGFPSMPENLAYRPISNISLYAYWDVTISGKSAAWGYETADAAAAWDAESVTYDSYGLYEFYYSGMEWYNVAEYNYSGPTAKQKELYSIPETVLFGYKNGWPRLYGTGGSCKPYLIVTYGDEDVTPVVKASNLYSYAPKTLDNVFTWSVSQSDYSCSGRYTQASAVFRWKATESETPVEISLTTEQSVTIPANTLTGNQLIYQVEVITNTGDTVTTEWITLSTTGPLPTILASPNSGFIPKHAAGTYTWSLQMAEGAVEESVQESAIFRWRTGEGAAPLETALTTEQSVALPAETITTDSMQWQVSIQLSPAGSLTSDWFTCSTVEPLSSAVCLSPRNSIADNSRALTFQWSHVTSSGLAPTASELQQSVDNDEWTTLATIQGSATEYLVPANTLPAGQLYWRVRTYNTDEIAGEWSQAAGIIVIAAPTMPSVSVDSGPRPTITWQAEGQQAYQLRIDNDVDTVRYGTGKSLKWGEYLPVGSYIAGVRVQNKYGLWSEWGSIGFAVTEPAYTIPLTVEASHVASLSWPDGGYDKYYIYRDGVPVAKIGGTAYVDNESAGSVTYKLIGAYDGSDTYGSSVDVTVNIVPDTLMICDLDEGAEWIFLELSSTQTRSESISFSRTVSYMYFAGAGFPSAEISESQDRTITFMAAFKERGTAQRFDRLIGHRVIVKTRGGDIAIGPLAAISKTSNEFYTAYNCSVRHCRTQEAIELDT